MCFTCRYLPIPTIIQVNRSNHEPAQLVHVCSGAAPDPGCHFSLAQPASYPLPQAPRVVDPQGRSYNRLVTAINQPSLM